MISFHQYFFTTELNIFMPLQLRTVTASTKKKCMKTVNMHNDQEGKSIKRTEG